MQRSKLRKYRKPMGRCYELSGKLVVDENEGVLVHGTVYSPVTQCRIGHAWVEVPVGTVIHGKDGTIALDVPGVVDLTLRNPKHRLLPHDLYYALMKAEPIVKYTPHETRVKIVESKIWGPWHQVPVA